MAFRIHSGKQKGRHSPRSGEILGTTQCPLSSKPQRRRKNHQFQARPRPLRLDLRRSRLRLNPLSDSLSSISCSTSAGIVTPMLRNIIALFPIATPREEISSNVASQMNTSADSPPSPLSSPLTLTHRHSNVLRAADCLTRLLQTISNGTPLRKVRMTAA